MDRNYPTVTIGCPVRDREIYLFEYLKCIKNIDYPLENITLLFIENDSKDKTLKTLNNFKKENKQLFNDIIIKVYNQKTSPYPDTRDKYIREKYIYQALSNLRNFWLLNIKTDYAFSVDSDIMFSPSILKQLLSHQVDYVSGLIINGYIIDKENSWKYTNILVKAMNTYVHKNNYPENKLIEVDFSGAIMLLSQKACKVGKFGYSVFGEDACFCESLIANGIKLYCDTGARATHCMSKEYLDLYKEGKFIF